MAQKLVNQSQLCAANNTALMLAAKLREQMEKENPRGWYKEFRVRIRSMCEQCHLTASTIERYVKVGAMMLQSRVLMCLLPSFIELHKNELAVLLASEAVMARWEQAFDEAVAGGGSHGAAVPSEMAVTAVSHEEMEFYQHRSESGMGHSMTSEWSQMHQRELDFQSVPLEPLFDVIAAYAL